MEWRIQELLVVEEMSLVIIGYWDALSSLRVNYDEKPDSFDANWPQRFEVEVIDGYIVNWNFTP
jgi:hypothetical protein